eukprot:TRINITY_DN49150_c0_g1_i1.p1 TRINITY_DN49150_c0_g1~~TRINITY_DN49150_c0_g1_i1.p1  ORF type:complete len:650 (-),score=25.79 TRINITY_DN49150_c0_g1_i1:98-2047(-)
MTPRSFRFSVNLVRSQKVGLSSQVMTIWTSLDGISWTRRKNSYKSPTMCSLFRDVMMIFIKTDGNDSFSFNIQCWASKDAVHFHSCGSFSYHSTYNVDPYPVTDHHNVLFAMCDENKVLRYNTATNTWAESSRLPRKTRSEARLLPGTVPHQWFANYGDATIFQSDNDGRTWTNFTLPKGKNGAWEVYDGCCFHSPTSALGRNCLWAAYGSYGDQNVRGKQITWKQLDWKLHYKAQGYPLCTKDWAVVLQQADNTYSRRKYLYSSPRGQLAPLTSQNGLNRKEIFPVVLPDGRFFLPHGSAWETGLESPTPINSTSWLPPSVGAISRTAQNVPQWFTPTEDPSRPSVGGYYYGVDKNVIYATKNFGNVQQTNLTHVAVYGQKVLQVVQQAHTIVALVKYEYRNEAQLVATQVPLTSSSTFKVVNTVPFISYSENSLQHLTAGSPNGKTLFVSGGAPEYPVPLFWSSDGHTWQHVKLPSSMKQFFCNHTSSPICVWGTTGLASQPGKNGVVLALITQAAKTHTTKLFEVTPQGTLINLGNMKVEGEPQSGLQSLPSLHAFVLPPGEGSLAQLSFNNGKTWKKLPPFPSSAQPGSFLVDGVHFVANQQGELVVLVRREISNLSLYGTYYDLFSLNVTESQLSSADTWVALS